MNKIINEFLFAGDKFMPETHLKQPWFTYNACETFTKYKERIQKFKETGDSRYIYQNELDKDWTRRLAPDKILCDKHFILLPKNGFQRGLALMVFKCFDKKPLPCTQTNLLLVVLKMKRFQI